MQLCMYSSKEQVIAAFNHNDKRRKEVQFTSDTLFEMKLASSNVKTQPDDISSNYSLPKVSLKLNYKRISQPDHLIHHVPQVYTDDRIFNWNERDYLLNNVDRSFLH